MYYKTIFYEKWFSYVWNLHHLDGNSEFNYKTSKSLVDSIIAQSRFDEKEAENGFKIFAPLFKQVYPEIWKKHYGDKKIPYCRLENGEIIYV